MPGDDAAEKGSVIGMAQVIPSVTNMDITQEVLDSLNVAQATEDNQKHLMELGGVQGLATQLKIDLKGGLTKAQVTANRERYGPNIFPEKPMKTFLQLFIEAFDDTTLMILIAAAVVSLGIGYYEDPQKGWIEGVAILIAVLLVSTVTATNDYQKEKQFRDLEKNSEALERATVIRDGTIVRISPDDLVIGDVVSCKSGDGIPADGILFEGSGVKCNESALTGEPDDLNKRVEKDPFFLSSCVVTDTGTSGDAKIIIIGVGRESQWGKIKANLTSEAENTPLQDKLDDMVELIGKGGAGAAFLTFVTLIAMIWIAHDGKQIGTHIVEAFIIAVTIVVVAIPEGLPLAVTISLSYSSSQMLEEGNLIRQLQACETMGNATNICTDKTGTLTENRMTIVEGFFEGKHRPQEEFNSYKMEFNEFCLNGAINGNVFLQDKDEFGNALDRCKVVGSATEGALVLLLRKWGQDYAAMREKYFNNERDMQFPFNSTKKRSTIVLTNYDGGAKVLVKGASEVVLLDCTHYISESGEKVEIDAAKRTEFSVMIDGMADRALRTLCLAHRDFANEAALPVGYKEDPPDSSDLILDSIIGIIDPLRSDVKDAVLTAQGAGVMVRMVTGDNIKTAVAIALQCGIYTGTGESLTKERYESIKGDQAALNALLPKVAAIEGPCFRNLTPAQADLVLQRVQVMARSSPDDKYLMVTRLNGHHLPKNQEEWEKLHPAKSWAKDKDSFLPGYEEEWLATRPNGGQVVGVTGDGTNDAPALKASDVGLSMGITGTKVAQNASDIVITDDKFSSIVRAILWGRSVYDNIRRFLQFQLTVNVVALTITFIGCLAQFPPPLNAVMMLWVNLIMDTMGALALGTEKPTPELLKRQPYLRDSALVSKPMWRNILTQSAYQLVLLLALLFMAPDWYNIESGQDCQSWRVSSYGRNVDLSSIAAGTPWIYGNEDVAEFSEGAVLSCDESTKFYGADGDAVLAAYLANTACPTLADSVAYAGLELEGDAQTHMECRMFEDVCPETNNKECYDKFFSTVEHKKFYAECFNSCAKTDYDYTHFSLIFNAFVFCQVFNEFNARSILNDPNCFKGIMQSKMFLLVIFVTTLFQVFIIGLGGDWVRVTMINRNLWLWSVAFGAVSLPLGVLMRYIPIWNQEDSNCWFGYVMPS